jgi:hypothetical protein
LQPKADSDTNAYGFGLAYGSTSSFSEFSDGTHVRAGSLSGESGSPKKPAPEAPEIPSEEFSSADDVELD